MPNDKPNETQRVITCRVDKKVHAGAKLAALKRGITLGKFIENGMRSEIKAAGK